MENPDWGPEVWTEDEWESDVTETLQERLVGYGRNILIVLVLGGLLFLSGIYQGTLFRKTPEISQEPLLASEVLEDITVSLRVVVFLSDESRSSERTEENVEQMVRNSDALWNQAGIKVDLESTRFETVTDRDIELFMEYPADLFERYTETDFGGINVFLMKTLNGINGIAFASARTVAVADYTTVRDFRTLAHEVGHILRLRHTNNKSNLMFSGSNGTELTGVQIKNARSVAEKFRDIL